MGTSVFAGCVIVGLTALALWRFSSVPARIVTWNQDRKARNLELRMREAAVRKAEAEAEGAEDGRLTKVLADIAKQRLGGDDQ
jgi:hypothetical protein